MKRHILTVSVEAYFHSGDLADAVHERHWERLAPRLDVGTDAALALLERHHATATFFVSGWCAERQPAIVRRIVDAGHEVASGGYWPLRRGAWLPGEFRADLARAREALEGAGAGAPLGYRAPRWLREDELWVLDALAEEGYRYDSSINPVLRHFARRPEYLEAHRHRHPSRALALWELPVSTVSFAGLRVALAGGNYLRQLPAAALHRAADAWTSTRDAPLVSYVMSWELDPDQPRIGTVSALNRVRHYRNLAGHREALASLLTRHPACSAAAWLGVPRGARAPHPERPTVVTVRSDSERPPPGPDAVTVVVPVFNEEHNIDYLRRALLELRERLAPRFRLHVRVVDDGSRDGTWEELAARFAAFPDFEALRHPRNRGIAAAILTGLRAAPTEVVCSIDCDGSYDPALLAEMIPLLDGADIVTASPYHPRGRVTRVPAWRLLLSRTLSRLYNALLAERIHTFTSCCRVYRRSVVLDLPLRHEGFLGVAELLVTARLRGARVREHPATLDARLLGVSKMKTLRTIRGHLGLLGELTRRRLQGALPR